jgi:hypothetical protein
MFFLCKVLVISPESELLSRFLTLNFKCLPFKGNFCSESRRGQAYVTEVEWVIPVVDLPWGINSAWNFSTSSDPGTLA